MLYVQDPKASRIHMVFSPVSPEIAGTITHTTQKHVYNIKKRDAACALNSHECVLLTYSPCPLSLPAPQATDGTGTWGVSDQGSTNGTYHNGDKLSPLEWRALGPGDEVNVGGRGVLRWRVVAPGSEPPSAPVSTEAKEAPAETCGVAAVTPTGDEGSRADLDLGAVGEATSARLPSAQERGEDAISSNAALKTQPGTHAPADAPAGAPAGAPADQPAAAARRL